MADGAAPRRRQRSCALLDDDHLAHRVDPVARGAVVVGLSGVGDGAVGMTVEVVDEDDLEELRAQQVPRDAGEEQSPAGAASDERVGIRLLETSPANGTVPTSGAGVVRAVEAPAAGADPARARHTAPAAMIAAITRRVVGGSWP